MFNNEIMAWEREISELACPHIQLSRKYVHEIDKVERDEGIWIFNAENKIDIQPFFKDVPLQTRVKLITTVKVIAETQFRRLLRDAQLQHVEKLSSCKILDEIEETAKDKSYLGGFFIKNGVPQNLKLNIEYESYSTDLRIKIAQRLLKITVERFDTALRELNNLEHITTNHDYKR